jgi:hypothetical protein
MQQRLGLVALVVSLIALAVAGSTYFQADARAEAALQRRERELVRRYSPPIRRICADFRMSVPEGEPQTLEELFEPLGRLLEGLSK